MVRVNDHGMAYGRFSIDGKKHTAHRVAYSLIKGLVPKELQVCHSCDNTICVNPEHLFLGTNQTNQQDSIDKGRGGRVVCCGESNGLRKLTREIIHCAKELRDSGWTYQKIADHFSVGRRTMERALTGKDMGSRR